MALKATFSQANTGVSTTCTVPVSGIAAGDYIVFCAGSGGGTTNTFTFPTGFTQPLPNQNVSTVNTGAIAVKVATGTEGSSLSFVSSSNDYQTGLIRVYSGRSGVITASAASGTFGNSPLTLTGTAITAAAGDDVCIMVNAKFYDPTNNAYTGYVAGYSDGLLLNNSVQYSPVIVTEDAINVAAGNFATNGTLSWTGGGSVGYSTFILSLAKASSGGGGAGLTGAEGYPGFSLIRLGGR